MIISSIRISDEHTFDDLFVSENPDDNVQLALSRGGLAVLFDKEQAEEIAAAILLIAGNSNE